MPWDPWALLLHPAPWAVFVILWFLSTVDLLALIHVLLDLFFLFFLFLCSFLHLLVSESISSTLPCNVIIHLQLPRTEEVWGPGGIPF